MPLYGWTSEYQRNDDRYICYVPGLGVRYRSRLIYCNYHNITLEDIDGLFIHHIDEDKSNDSPDNLELVDPLQHAEVHPGRASGNRSAEIRERFSKIQSCLWKDGFYNNRKKRKRHKHEHLVNQILDLHHKGETKVSISKKLGIPRSSVYYIIVGEDK